MRIPKNPPDQQVKIDASDRSDAEPNDLLTGGGSFIKRIPRRTATQPAESKCDAITVNDILKFYANAYIKIFNRADSTLDQPSTQNIKLNVANDIGVKFDWNRKLIEQFIEWTVDHYHQIGRNNQNPFWLLLSRRLIETYITRVYKPEPGDIDLRDIKYPIRVDWRRTARQSIDESNLQTIVKFVAYLVIEACDYYTHETWVSQTTLARRANCDIRTIQRALIQLDRSAFIARQKRFNQDGTQTSDLIQFQIEKIDQNHPGI